MRNWSLFHINPCTSVYARTLRRRSLPLSVAVFLTLNTIACHNSQPGNHEGLPPQAVEVVATLLGVAAEIGTLALTKNHLAAAGAAGVTGGGVAYVINELGLSCKACGTTSTYKGETVQDITPAPLSCNNPNCRRFAYLVVSNSEDRLLSMLEYLKASLQPTCLLMRELTAENEIQLRWVSHNATDASLNGEPVRPNGSIIVYPEHTTTYALKVIGANGRSEDSVIVEIAEEVEPEDDDNGTTIVPTAPPPPPSLPPAIPDSPKAPTMELTRVSVRCDKIEVYEDGSLGATDWSFEILLNEIGLITVPKRSFHDDDRRIVQFGRQSVDAIIQGDVLNLRVSGYNFDSHRRAEGALHLSLAGLSGSYQQRIEVSAPDDYKKGYFVFYLTVTR